jgi:hypothetical protein
MSAERVIAISEQCEEGTALHLKIESWHQNNKANGLEQGYPRTEDIKTVLMQRKHLLKTLDPLCSKLVEEVLVEMRAMKSAYVEMIINNAKSQPHS